MVQVGGMMNARFEAFEDRLLPERRPRPPLAADKHKLAPPPLPARTQAVRAPVASLQPPARAAPKPAKGKKGGNRKKAAQILQRAPAMNEPLFVPAPAPEPLTEQWVTVARRGARNPPASGGAGPKPVQRKPPPPRKLRTPPTSAVVLSLQPAAQEKGATYAKILAEAKAKVDLSTLGISGLRFRVAATGARVLVLPGAQSGDKADTLAAKLREAIGDDVVYVSRPTRCAELRISGLDDSVSPPEVAAAVARVGECAVEAVKVGDIRQNASGLGTAWVRCPVVAAKKVVQNGRLLVGFVSAQVQLLDARPLQCHRCLEFGHVKAQCPSEQDRSGQCYRCGQEGHKSGGCSRALHCPVCAANKKSADHRMGSISCTARQGKKSRLARGVVGSAPITARPVATRAEEMDTAGH